MRTLTLMSNDDIENDVNDEDINNDDDENDVND